MRSLDTFFVPAGLSEWAVLAFMVVIPYLPDAFQVGKNSPAALLENPAWCRSLRPTPPGCRTPLA
jgi:hypothetical protein